MNEKIDCCFLIASSSKRSYQKLSRTYSAIEPPTWALLLAQSMRSVNFSVKILDANAENLNEEMIFEKLKAISPRLICFVVYGQNVNAGTANMSGAIYVADFLKQKKRDRAVFQKLTKKLKIQSKRSLAMKSIFLIKRY